MPATALPIDPEHRYVVEDDAGFTHEYETRGGIPGAAVLFVEGTIGILAHGEAVCGDRFDSPAPHLLCRYGPLVFVVWRRCDWRSRTATGPSVASIQRGES